MKVICKVQDAECPKGLHICCHTCEDKDTCNQCCDDVFTSNGYEDCDQHEVITGDLVQFESAVPDTLKAISNLMVVKKELEEQEKQLKQALVEAMETYGVKMFETDIIKLTYVAPTTRSTIDSTRLKKEHPDIAEQYSKTSNMSASVRVTVK